MLTKAIKVDPLSHKRFSEISGDSNPIHMDAVVARRTLFGVPVVHGIHTLLLCLDAAALRHREIGGLRDLRVTFELPIGIDAPFRIEFDGGPSSLRFRLISRDGVAVRGRFDFGPMPSITSKLPAEVSHPGCADLGPDDLDGKSGKLRLGIAPELLAVLFPNVAARFDLGQIAAILATTRLVGMECPGLHSIFGGLRMQFDVQRAILPILAYRVTNWAPQFRMLQIAVDCGHATGSIDCFLRPSPVLQLGSAQIRADLAPEAFAGVRALVVGGSRGLGELTAKVLAAGGADVTLTYVIGETDAAVVVDDILRSGGRASTFKLDVTAPSVPDHPDMRFSHVFFFATPRFHKNLTGKFNFRQFEKYVSFYVAGMSKTIDVLRPHLDNGAVFCLPSTELIDTAKEGFREYISAKHAAEAAVTHMTDQSLRFEIVRLPRLRTDQTNSLSDAIAGDPLPAILSLVQRVVALTRQD